MKKLMIVAAAAAMTVSAQAGIAVAATNCTKGVETSCPEVVFRVTGSGKALDLVSKDYLTVSKLKVNGWLVLFPSEELGKGTCCYPWYSLYINARIGKNTTGLIFAGADAEAVNAWTVFGKKLNDATSTDGKKSKKFNLDSQLGISADYVGGNGNGTLVYANDVAANDGEPLVTFIATAFGKATWKNTVTPGCNKCDKPTFEGFEVTPKSYSGWFAGFYQGSGLDEECFTCACTDLALFGGTWKAKYQEKVSSWEAAISDLFGHATLKNMQDEGIE